MLNEKLRTKAPGPRDGGTDTTGGCSLHEAWLVSRCHGDQFIASIPGGVCIVRRAFSCLVDPLCGDRVLISCSGETAYILQVLERMQSKDRPAATELSAPGTLVLRSHAGDVRVRAATDVDLSATGEIRSTATSMLWNARRGAATLSRFDVSMNRCNWHIDRLQGVARQVRHSVDQMIFRARVSLRTVTESDVMHSSSLMQRVKSLWSVSSERSVLDSSKETRINGDQIHMG